MKRWMASVGCTSPRGRTTWIHREDVQAETREEAEREALRLTQAEGHIGTLRVALLSEVPPPNPEPVAIPSAGPGPSFRRRRHPDYPRGLCNRCGREPHHGPCKPFGTKETL